MTQAVGQYRGAQAVARIQSVLDNEKFLARAASAAIKGLDPKYLASTALNVIRMSDKLQQCDPMSIAGALCQAASVNLIPGDGTGRAWLIPRGGQCDFQIGYQGWRELALRSGMVASIIARPVYQGDDFRYSFGIQDVLEHQPGPGHGIDSSKITHVYAVAHMKDGPPVVEVMVREQIERSRQCSKMPNGPAWKNHYDEMARKTAVIRVCKMLPRTTDIGNALNIESEHTREDREVEAEVLESTFETPQTSPDTTSLIAGGEASPSGGAGSSEPLYEPPPPPAASSPEPEPADEEPNYLDLIGDSLG